MGAAGERREREPGKPRRAAEHPPVGHGGLSFRVGLLPPAAFGVEPSERHVDDSGVLGRAALDDGPIGLADLAVLEQQAEMGGRLAVTAEHEASRRVAIEPVGEDRRARQAEAQRAEGILERDAALVVGAARSAMHGQAGGLVDDQHQPVAIKQPRQHLFRRDGPCRWHRLSLEFRRGRRPPPGLPFNRRNRYHGRPMEDTPENQGTRSGWWRRLSSGLRRTSGALGGAVADLVTKRKLDRAMVEEIEDVLVRADLGVDVAQRIADAVAQGRYDRAISADEVKTVVAAEVEKVLQAVARPMVIDAARKPFAILVVGVNGSGKTTTIGKLAAKLRGEGRDVMLAAGDTFRAAAVEQLKIWGERTRSPVIAREHGADAAGLAFEAMTRAAEAGADVLLIDTAGRLQNRAELMGELEKVIRVIRKVDATAPHAVLLVLDATVGQNALSQVEAFAKTAGVTGLVMTKLDGTARGGILVAVAAKFALPVHFIGVGEGVDDLAAFTARDFARAIAGLED